MLSRWIATCRLAYALLVRRNGVMTKIEIARALHTRINGLSMKEAAELVDLVFETMKRRVRCERQRGGILVSSASLSTILDTKGTPEVRGKPWKKRVPHRFSPGGEEGGSFDHPGRSPSAQALTPRRARLGACARAAHLP